MGLSTLGGAIVAVVVLALCFWVLGSLALRLAGYAVFFAGLVSLAVDGGSPSLFLVGLTITLVGVALWLAGHWLFAFKHHYWRSTVAQRILLRVARGRLDPTRNWGTRVISIQD